MIEAAQRWEYLRLDLDILEMHKPAFSERLDGLGSEGWELITSVQHERHGYSHEVHLLFKRPRRERSADQAAQ